MNESLPQRKPLRLKSHDYSQGGTYFITICTYQRQCILGRISPVGAIHESPEPTLTPAGSTVERYIRQLPIRFSSVTVDAYVVMPNHIHLLLTFAPKEVRAIRESPLRTDEGRSELSKVIGYLKMNASRDIRKLLPLNEIWQRGYHDHVIRDENDFLRVWTYIENNPLKWELDRYYRELPQE